MAKTKQALRITWAAGGLVITFTLCLPIGARTLRFFDDDPIWREPVTQDVTAPSRYEPTLTYTLLVNLFGKPGDPELGQRARDLNTVDEVPDGPFFANHAGRVAMTSEGVARGANLGSGPADGPWRVVAAKSDGITPGFTVRDRNEVLWFLKFDPPGWRGMATGAEIITAKLFWAVGYHTVEYYLARLTPSLLLVEEGATVAQAGERERALQPADLERLLRRAERDADGSYRVIASKAAPGRPVGRLRFEGTRADDPNDVIPAEHRRSLRGYSVFAAWLNHVDAKAINSIAVLVDDGGRRHIRRYLLDFGSTLGSAAIGPREEWQGYEPLVERLGEVGRRVVSGGLRVPAWRRTQFFVAPSVGRLPRDHQHWDPVTWQPHAPNAAFRHARADDRFWAAYKLTFISDAMIGAAVREGQLGDAEAEGALAEMIAARRDRILRAYLPQVNPVVGLELQTDELTLNNAAVAARVAPPPTIGYRASWFLFDNATGESEPLATTESAGTRMPAPPLPSTLDTFVRVDVAAVGAAHESWTRPVSAYFRRQSDGWKLVGFERIPEG